MASELAAVREVIAGIEATLMTPQSVSSLLTVVEAARELRVSRSRVFQLLAAGELEGVRVGRARCVPRRSIEDFVARLRRFNGTAPLPVWSSNHRRQRLSRVGSRQLNCALHRIAITQAHWHPEARAYLQRRKDTGDTNKEALRVLKRRLSDIAYKALLADSESALAGDVTRLTVRAA